MCTNSTCKLCTFFWVFGQAVSQHVLCFPFHQQEGLSLKLHRQADITNRSSLKAQIFTDTSNYSG